MTPCLISIVSSATMLPGSIMLGSADVAIRTAAGLESAALSGEGFQVSNKSREMLSRHFDDF